MELALWDKKFRLAEIMADILPSLIDETASTKAAVDQHRAELKEILRELEEAKFNRVTINQRLGLYAGGDADWPYQELKPVPTRKRTKKTTK